MDLVIRRAQASDMPAVAKIYAHYVATSVATFDETAPEPGYWEQRLAASSLPFLVAERGSDILGYSYASPWKPRPAYRHTAEDSVYVAPGLSGQGLGTVLLGALLDGCSQAGLRQLIAVIADGAADGAASVALHRRFGFSDAGTLRAVGFKHERWLDTTLMQLDLT
jgi:L-amino acid N-acyltransferase YncA